MSSSSFSESLQEFRRAEKIKARSNYSGGFKYPEQRRPLHLELLSMQPEEQPLSEHDILNLMGVTKPEKLLELVPNRDLLPENKTELIDQLIGNIEHKIGKIRFLREKEILRQKMRDQPYRTF